MIFKCYFFVSGNKISNKYPGVSEKTAAIPYIVTAKLGEISCGFCKLVSVVAPLIPIARLINATHTYGRSPKNVRPISKQPGITWATKNEDTIAILF